MIYEVRIYDGKGKLKKTIEKPIFDCFAVVSKVRTTLKVCIMCKTMKQFKSTQKYCSKKCSQEYKSIQDKARRLTKKRDFAAKPTIPCEICDKPLPRHKSKYCKKECAKKGRRLKDMSEQKRRKETLCRLKVKEKNTRKTITQAKK
tara:strand:+ start:110 stop:547 length:438 start_codon:yes stop_codon:yes gene_type:complete